MPSRKHVWIGLSVCLGLTVVAVPNGVSAYKRWRDASRRASLQDFLRTNDEESQWVLTPEAEEEALEQAAQGPHEETWDEPFKRAIAWRNHYGVATPELTTQWARVAHAEAQKWAGQMPGARRPKAIVSGQSWVNLGPTDAKFQFNGTQYTQVDSGRTTGIALHPANPDIAYTATSGGGVWKTFNFSAQDPNWFPVTESIGNLAIGAMAMDPSNPETLYIGLGDFIDVAGGQLLKTTNGGISWSAPVTLSGTYTLGATQLTVTALRVRALEVDPNNSNIVLVGTNVGLFRSTDAGQSYALVDLPNSDRVTSESVWSIAYTGQVNGQSRWAISGAYAANAASLPPDTGFGSAATPGDIWTSEDAGASWSSRKAAGALPATAVGRIDLGAGTPSAQGVTVIYAQLAAATETASAGYWRSLDSGQTFTVFAPVLSNPTNSTSGSACRSANVSGQQAYYNQAIAVDPANDDNVLVGGMLCGLRSVNATSANPTWELVSHWLPSSGLSATAAGPLPYVHADWHVTRIFRTAGGYIAVAGTDGGLFVSRNLFTPGPVNDTTVTWGFPNRGIVTHLFYSVASGDEVTGNAFVTYGGLQDNGTRFRDSAQSPTTFNQVVGGDGIGATVVQVPGDTTYWTSVQFSPRLCDPDQFDCNVGANWYPYRPELTCAGDSHPFFVRYAALRTATAETGTGLLYQTSRGVYRLMGDPFTSDTAVWQLLGNPAVTDGTGACHTTTQRNVMASATVDGLYGVPSNGGRYRVTANCTLATPADQCQWRVTSTQGLDLNGDGTLQANELLLGTSSIDFPPGPTAEPAGQVFVVSSVAPTTGAGTPVPDALGHVFVTRNGGTTWQSLKGNGTGFDLPNVPTAVIRFDPGDLTNSTLYAGTDLGIYRTTDGGQTWRRFGYGLPLVKVTDMFVSRTGAFLRVATYGRGLWEIYPSATAEKGVNGNGDFDRNQQLDWLDVLSTANRMGTSPATMQAPLYDWNQDVTGSVNAIDDTDLSQILNRFGGRP